MDDILATFFTAMTPIGELRASIPIGITGGLAWYEAFGWSVIGNLVPVIILLPTIDRLARWLLSFPNPLGKLLIWRIQKLRGQQGNLVRRWGPLALIPLVAIPLPITGAWTGCLMAWAFDIPPRKAFFPILTGIMIAGAVVTALVEFSVNFPFIRH